MSDLPNLTEKVNEMCLLLKTMYGEKAISSKNDSSHHNSDEVSSTATNFYNGIDGPNEYDKSVMKAFLLCHKEDVHSAVEYYRTYKRIHYSQKMEGIDPLDPSVREELLSGKFTVVPASLNDPSCKEHLCIFFGHLHWPMDVILRDTIKMVLLQLNALVQLSASLQIVTVALILDLSQSQYSNFDMNLCTSLLYILKDNFPLRVSRIFVIGMPPTLDTNRKILTRFLKGKVRSRVFFLDSHLMLFQYMSPSQIPRNLLPQAEGPEVSHEAWIKECFKLLSLYNHVLSSMPDYFHVPSETTKCNSHLSATASVYLSRRFSSNSLKRGPRHTNNRFQSPFSYSTFTPVNRRSASFHVVNSPLLNSTPLTSRLQPNNMNNIKDSPSHKRHQHDVISSNIPGHRATASLSCTRRPIRPEHKSSPTSSDTDSDPNECLLNGNVNGSNMHHSDHFPYLARLTDSHFVNALPACQAESQTSSTALLSKSVFQPNRNGYTIEQLQSAINRRGEAGLLADYEQIRRSTILGPCEISRKLENRVKCRYSDVPCLDETRVKLPPNDGFVHANWVDGYKETNAYISAQGPLESTTEDFWCMIYHYKAPIIVMVTKLIEKDKSKCFEYWPSKTGTVHIFGSYTVTNEGADVQQDFTVTKLLVRYSKEEEHHKRHRVLHYHFTNWPDYDIPGNPQSFLEFVNRVQCVWDGMRRAYRGTLPIVVHCSAGIGRSGTFIVVDICIRRLADQGLVDVGNVVQNIRTQRFGSIQMPRQYVFIHLAILTYAENHKDIIARALAASGAAS